MKEKEILQKLRTKLRGYYPEIAKDCNTSVTTVSRVLQGKMVNNNIMLRAIEVKDRIIKEEQEILTKASQGL